METKSNKNIFDNSFFSFLPLFFLISCRLPPCILSLPHSPLHFRSPLPSLSALTSSLISPGKSKTSARLCCSMLRPSWPRESRLQELFTERWRDLCTKKKILKKYKHALYLQLPDRHLEVLFGKYPDF